MESENFATRPSSILTLTYKIEEGGRLYKQQLHRKASTDRDTSGEKSRREGAHAGEMALTIERCSWLLLLPEELAVEPHRLLVRLE